MCSYIILHNIFVSITNEDNYEVITSAPSHVVWHLDRSHHTHKRTWWQCNIAIVGHNIHHLELKFPFFSSAYPSPSASLLTGFSSSPAPSSIYHSSLAYLSVNPATLPSHLPLNSSVSCLILYQPHQFLSSALERGLPFYH